MWGVPKVGGLCIVHKLFALTYRSTLHTFDETQRCQLYQYNVVLIQLAALGFIMLNAKNLLKSIELKVELPMVLEIDNKGAVDLINSFTVGGHTCHMNIKQCFLRELKVSKKLIVNWI